MPTITTEQIIARARTIATQTANDANQSVVIDDKAALFALIPHCVTEVFRRKANDQKFFRDITVRQTIAMTAGTGAVPDTVLREFLHQADFTDANNSLITYFNYAADFNSTTTYAQLGYVYVLGNDFKYRAPNNNLTYTGDLFVTVPSTPSFAASMTFPSEATINDIILLLSMAILGQVKFEVISVAT